MTAHTCPPCCHVCPDADDDVIPGCLGTAAMGSADPKSFEWCTCEAKLPTDNTPEGQISLLAARVAQLEERLARIEAQQ